MSNTNGLTKTEITSFFDLLIKSNNYQLELLRKSMNKEINKREAILK